MIIEFHHGLISLYITSKGLENEVDLQELHNSVEINLSDINKLEIISKNEIRVTKFDDVGKGKVKIIDITEEDGYIFEDERIIDNVGVGNGNTTL